ncbi:MAG: Fic family protein [Candidatus Nanoarchaeia archaeon]|nr:Fic family protein [Candidatus Nanoarchaeia archaeon]MDD5587512.1 Fic family protein [Candidatus Nanoarchaeia archaeon]
MILKKKLIGNQVYYYLEHSIRKDDKILKKEIYLGKQLPKNLDDIKKKFIFDLYKEKWFDNFSIIKQNHSKEEKLMPKSAKEKELENFIVKFTYNTQRIEGSKLSLRDTANLLEKGINPKEKPVRDIREAENHQKIFFEILNYKKDLSLQIILQWHKELFHGTKEDIAGKIRKHQVLISGSKFIPPLPAELDFLLKEFFKWYNENKNKINPVELAALTHLKFVTIHPFSDGNGRISRLMMNFVLNKNKMPMLDIAYINRNSYYNSLERSQVKKNELIFLQWFFKRYLTEFKRFLK